MTTTWHTAPDPELDAEGLRTVAELSQRQDFLAAIRGRSLDTFIRYAQAIWCVVPSLQRGTRPGKRLNRAS